VAKLLMVLAGISGMVAVGLGAFGAHALRAQLGPDALRAYQTGVEYQFIHTIALLFVALLCIRYPQQSWWAASGWLFTAGIVLFSGSLYLLATAGWRWLGPVTPLGGLSFILGWLCLAIGAWRTTY
jgi:uncharacterized membrane protein YgdD (TMEM256/DUF423 family)